MTDASTTLTALDHAKIEAGFMPAATLENVEHAITDTLAKLATLRALRDRMMGTAPFHVRGATGTGYCIADADNFQIIPPIGDVGLGLHDANALCATKNADANDAPAD